MSGLARTRTRTVRWPEAGSWRPSGEAKPGIGHPAPSEAQIAEGRTTTEKLPTVKELP